MAHSSSRAEGIMRQTHPEERGSVRVSLHLSGAVRVPATDYAEHLALVRDVSFNGIFFYSNFKPAVDSALQLSLAVPIAGKNLKILCQGKVVRVEESASSTCGIAIKVLSCEFVPLVTA